MPEEGEEKAGADMIVEGFGQTVEFGGVSFSSVKLFHPRKGIYGTLHPPTCGSLITISHDRKPGGDVPCRPNLRRPARDAPTGSPHH